MQLHIGSKHLAADVAMALDVEGREHLVIVAKATWSIPEPGQRPRPLPPQPLVLADEYLGEPGQSAMRYGADMVRFKPRCDVILDACAHSPTGEPVAQMLAGFEVGGLRKLVRVHGPRRWRRQQSSWRLTAAEPFVTQPLHHGLALGGSREFEHNGQRLTEAHLHNPVGSGWAGTQTLAQLDGQTAPQLEHPEEPVTRPDAQLLPCALSAIGRHWLPRRQFAGTYDEAWQRDVFPLLPLDFDEQFHQCAPLDQQMPYPQGGEAVRLIHLMPGRPEVSFKLPQLKPLVRVLRTDYTQVAPDAHLDTLFLEIEQMRFSAVWRASVPIRRSLQEVTDVAVGPIDPLWWRARAMGRVGVGCRNCREPLKPNRASGDLDEGADAFVDGEAT